MQIPPPKQISLSPATSEKLLPVIVAVPPMKIDEDIVDTSGGDGGNSPFASFPLFVSLSSVISKKFHILCIV